MSAGIHLSDEVAPPTFSPRDAEEALREALLNVEGIETEIALVKRRLNEWLERFHISVSRP